MWYGCYCPDRKGAELLRSYKHWFSEEALADVFILTYDRMRRYGGTWHVERKPLFPDYVFLESRDSACLEAELQELGQRPGRMRILGMERSPVSVQPEEEAFLRGMCGSAYHVGMSRGYICGGRTYVTEGPLCGKEAWIRKIDRHKRLARLAIPSGTGRRELQMQMGLEIFEKR